MKAMYLSVLPLLLMACSTPHEEAVRIAVAEWGWKRSSIVVREFNPFAPGQPAPADAPCKFYSLNATDRLDGGVFPFAEDAQGRLVGTAADADYAGLARVLQQCLAHSDDASAWAEVIADFISAGWLGVIGEHTPLTLRQMKEEQLPWHAPLLRQTAEGRVIEFWARHGFSDRITHVRATLGHDGRLQVQTDPPQQ